MKKIYPLYKQEKIDREDLRKKLNPKEKKIFNNFIDFCKMSCNEESAGDTETVLFQIRDVMEKPLTSLKKEDVIKFCGVVNSSSRGEWAKSDSKAILKRFIKFYYKDWSSRFGDLNQTIKNKNISVNHDKINSGTLLTEEELERMLRSATILRDKLVLILSYELGARPHELRLMKWSQVKLNREPAVVTLITHKGGKDESRTLPLNESKIHFERWEQEYPYPNKNQNDYVFPNPRHREKPLTDNGFSYIIPKIAKIAGIQKRVWGYLLRHTRLTDIRKKGMQEKIAMLFGGHSDPDVSSLYTHLNSDDLQNEVLTKIYHVTEPTKEQRDEYLRRIEKLEQALEELGLGRGVIDLTPMDED
jgi:integrase